MVGGSQVGVDAGAVRRQGQLLGRSAQDVVGVADRVGAALGQVAGAVGAGALQGAAAAAGRGWGEGLSGVGRAGEVLAGTTEATAVAYEALEARQVRRLTPDGVGR